MVALLDAEQHLVCPNCTHTVVVRGAPAPGGGMATMHACRGLAGMLAPMVADGVRCKVEAHERDDYIGAERVRLDGEGRPVMAVSVTRDDGEDRTVFAPVAVGSMRKVQR